MDFLLSRPVCFTSQTSKQFELLGEFDGNAEISTGQVNGTYLKMGSSLMYWERCPRGDVVGYYEAHIAKVSVLDKPNLPAFVVTLRILGFLEGWNLLGPYSQVRMCTYCR